MEGAECGVIRNQAQAERYLQALRVVIEQKLGKPLSSIKIANVELRDVSSTTGQAEVEYALPAKVVGNDNWVSYNFEDGQWKVSSCTAPIGGESTTATSG